MFKYGEKRDIQTFFTTRSSTYKNSDKIVAKVLPNDILGALSGSSIPKVEADDLEVGNVDSDKGVIKELNTEIEGTDGKTTYRFAPYFITNLNNTTEAFQYMNNNNFSAGYLTLLLAPNSITGREDSYDDIKFYGDTFNMHMDNVLIKDNIVTVNNDNSSNINNITGVEFKIDNTNSNFLITVPNLSNHVKGVLNLEILDDIRFKSKDINNKLTNLNFRFLKNNSELNETFITNINKNESNENFLPIEADRLVLHDNMGYIVNPNEKGGLTLSIIEDIDNTFNAIYRNVLKITNDGNNNIFSNFNSSIIMKRYDNIKNNTTNIEPRIYFENSLSFAKLSESNNIEPNILNNYIFKITHDPNLFSKADLNFMVDGADILFNNTFNIKDNSLKNPSDTFITLGDLSINYDTNIINNTIRSIRFFKDMYIDRIIFDNIYLQNREGNCNINIAKNISVTGPNNFGTELTDPDFTSIDRYKNKTSSTNIIKYSNNIIGKYQLLEKYEGSFNNVLNKNNFVSKYYPFPDFRDISDIGDFKEKIKTVVNNLSIKFYLNNITEEEKKDNIIDVFTDIIATNINNINIRDIYIENLKKFFFVEPVEKKFVNGLMIEPENPAIILQKEHLSDEDIFNDLTKNTKRIYWYYNNDLIMRPYIDYHSMVTKPDDNSITFFNTMVSGGDIILTDIFDTYTYNDGVNDITEYIFENSCSFNGFVAMRENLSNNPRVAHFKIQGFFDRNNNVGNVEVIYQCDNKWNIKINGDYINNSLIITPEHNSIEQVIVSCSINLNIV